MISKSPHLSTCKLNIRKVLVTSDFSGLSDTAIKIAASLAGYCGSSLTVLHCISPVFYGPGIESIDLIAFDSMLKNAEARMRDEVSILPGVESVEHHFVVETGSVVQAVKTFIDEHHIDLIVCASHGASGIEKAVLGSTAEAIVHHVSCPVLVVGPKCRARTFAMGSILLCTNLTSGSWRPAQYATALAQEQDAQLTIVHIAAIRERAQGRVSRLKLRIKARELLPADIENWCHVKVVIVERQAAARSILSIAQRERADLIVAGVSEEGFLVNHLPWGTLTCLIHEAKCPILTVRGHFAK
jgi:nucleotide-binding universal stress UspA family protein